MARLVSRILLAPCLAVLLAASPALAQPSPAEKDRATSFGHEALEAFRKNEWTTAYARFAAADAVLHSPVFVVYMARCKRNLGDLLAARDLLARVAGQPLADDAPEPWKRARADAGRELSELSGRIPGLIVDLRGSASVTVDDQPIPPEALRAPIWLNPGSHTVRATRPGAPPASASVQLVEGDPPRKVVLEVAAPESPLPVAPPPVVPPPVVPPPARGPLAPGLALIGAGAAGLVAGAVMGGVGLAKAADAKVGCDPLPSGGLLCSRGVEGRVNLARGLQTGANVAFVAGGVVAAAGVALVIVRPGGARAASARVVPGAGSLWLEGSF